MNNMITLPTTIPLPDWTRASCRGVIPGLFFPEVGDMATVAAAKQVCKDCPIREACLRFALDNNETLGVWGGATAKERRRMKARPRPVDPT